LRSLVKVSIKTFFLSAAIFSDVYIEHAAYAVGMYTGSVCFLFKILTSASNVSVILAALAIETANKHISESLSFIAEIKIFVAISSFRNFAMEFNAASLKLVLLSFSNKSFKTDKEDLSPILPKSFVASCFCLRELSSFLINSIIFGITFFPAFFRNFAASCLSACLDEPRFERYLSMFLSFAYELNKLRFMAQQNAMQM